MNNDMNNGFTPADRELGWDDIISSDGKEFTVLPEGDYNFTVERFERGRTGSESKHPGCNMAIVTLRVHSPQGDVFVTDNITLHTSMEWKISQFFRALGMKKRGEQLRPDWPGTGGRSGRCTLIIKPYNGKDYNKVKEYHDPEEAPAPGNGGGQYWQ